MRVVDFGAGFLTAVALVCGCFSSHAEAQDGNGAEDTTHSDRADAPPEDGAADESAELDADASSRDEAPEDAHDGGSPEDSGDEEAAPADVDEGGLGDVADGEDGAAACTTDVDCPAGLSCLDGHCVFGWTRTGVVGRDLAVDSVGRVHRVGWFDADTDFDPGPGVDLRAPAGARDGFLLRLDDRGRYLDTRTLSGEGPASETRLEVVDIGPTDQPYVAGVTQTEAVDPFRFVPADVQVDRLSADMSTVEWTAALTSQANFENTPGATTLRVTDAGEVLVAGFYYGELRWGLLPTENVFGWGTAGFVARLTSAGDVAWVGAQRVSMGEDYCVISCLAPLGGGDLLVGGSSLGWSYVDLDLGPGEDWRDVLGSGFLTRVGGDGTYRWTHVLESETTSQQLAAASSGGVMLAGSFRGDVDLDPGPALDLRSSTAGGWDAYLILFDETFARQWTWTSGSATDDFLMGAVGDGAGRVYFVVRDGWAYSLLGFTEAGDLLWTRPVAGWVDDLAMRPPHGVHLAGRFSGTVDFDPGPGEDYHTAAGMTDTFVTRLTAEGTY